MAALRISDLNQAFSPAAGIAVNEPGVHVDELSALADLDVLAGPELLPDSPMSRAFARSRGDVLQLGVMPFPPTTAQAGSAAIARLLDRHVELGAEPTSTGRAEDVVREAKMMVLVGQIHRLCQEIRARSHRPV